MKDSYIDVDDRCKPGHSATPTQGGWADAVADGCTAIPEKKDATPRYTVEESKPAQESELGTESKPSCRQDPIPSDLLEKGAHYDENGHIVYSDEGSEPIKVIPERIDY